MASSTTYTPKIVTAPVTLCRRMMSLLALPKIPNEGDEAHASLLQVALLAADYLNS